MGQFCKEKSAIVYNPNSGDGKTQILSERLSLNTGIPRVSICDLDLSTHNELLVVYGGDGSLQSIASRCKQESCSPILVVAGGGSENTLRKMLIGKDYSVKLENLKRGNLPNEKLLGFHPGEINSELFIVAVGFGMVETVWSSYLASFRKKMPPKLARIATAFKTAVDLFPHKASFESVMVSREYGKLKIPTQRDLRGDELMEITLSGNGLSAFFQVAWTVGLWKLGLKMPNGIFDTQFRTEILKAPPDNGMLNIDGEIRKVSEEEYVLRRSKLEFLVTALQS